jgi:hypothetical protein
MKDTVSHYVPPHSPLTSTEPQVFSNNLTMPPPPHRPNQRLLLDVKPNRTHTHPDLHQHIIIGLQ